MDHADGASPAALVRGCLASLMKAALISDDVQSLHWRQDAARLRHGLVAGSGDLSNLKIDGLWWLAVGDAEAPDLRERESQVEFGQPKICPFTLAELTAPDFDIDRAVQHLRETAATG